MPSADKQQRRRPKAVTPSVIVLSCAAGESSSKLLAVPKSLDPGLGAKSLISRRFPPLSDLQSQGQHMRGQDTTNHELIQIKNNNSTCKKLD